MRARVVLVACFLVAATATAAAAADATISGLVVGVADGDTLTVLDAQYRQHRVRLAGIDAPEKRQAFGQRAKQNLSAMTYLRQADVQGGKFDRYGRIVGKVTVGGTDVNLRQVEVGLAWHYRRYAREQSPLDREAYAAAESAAKGALRGLWALPSPTPPWEFRRRGARSRR